jgi:L-lactate dehydrogenase complex protein LldF
VELRAQHVEAAAASHRLPTPEAAAMKAAAVAMTSPWRWRLAQRSSRLGRLLARGPRTGAVEQRRIRSLPPPLSAWTGTRDLPEPPAETFRESWAREGRS